MNRFVFLCLVFLHGGFAGGMVPVLSLHLGTLAPWAFALYFAGMVTGQALIHRFERLSAHRRCLAHWELAFAAALVMMAVFPTPAGFIVGRFFEGIGSGLVLPILFARTVRIPDWGTAEKRIGMLNSAFALGFVGGPAAISTLQSDTGTPVLLVGFAILFATAGVLSGPDPRTDVETPPETTKRGIEFLAPLFVAKATYGYMLSLLGAYALVLFPGIDIAWVMLSMAGVFVVGQVGVTLLLPRVGEPLVALAPVFLGVCAVVFGVLGTGWAIGLVALSQSMLLLIGYRSFNDVPSSARTFALYNMLSDPGMVVGAMLALAGHRGGFGLAALAAIAVFIGRKRR